MLLIAGINASGQIGINTETPKATLQVVGKNSEITSPDGIIAPKLTGDELAAKDTAYGNDQNGTLVYVTSAVTDPTDKTINLTRSGYFYYDAVAGVWQIFGRGNEEPWYSKTTGTGATTNSENIYQTGQIGVGSSTIDTNAQLDVASSTKGVLLPRLTTEQRDAIPATLANGLLIYNVSTNCFNYYDSTASKWLSLCGTLDPATFNLVDCTEPSGPAGTYKKGTSLNAANTYTLKLNVTSPGTYTILVKTNNGYSFSKSGTFTETGTVNIVLEGQGAPTNGPQTDAVSSVVFNGINVSPPCTLPGINVEGSTTEFTVNCAGATLHGTYLQGIALDGSDYIDVPVTAVTTPGAATVETAVINGIKFSSGSIIVDASTTSVRLYGSGTPVSTGTNSYSFTAPGSSACSISVAVASSVGTFANPANRCLEIMNAGSTADGYYWIKDTSNNKFKTYCDMSNGGWTLINSRSERQMLVIDKTQNFALGAQTAVNTVTTQTGVFNEYNFSLPASVTNNISNNNPAKEVRMIIKQQGHTGTALTDVENSTTAPVNDGWAKENYLNVNSIGGGNPYTGNYVSQNNVEEGKIFNIPLTKPSASNSNYFFNGTAFRVSVPGYYNSTGFFTGFYGARSYVATDIPANNVTYTYTSDPSKTFTFKKYDINDLFGLYINSERQLNHHIGTCGNSSDDFGGASDCTQGWSNWRPHNFNLRSGNYEGRILQLYVK
ncbi:hypothetical protein ACM39_03495 [Chryseobacterium sp. FH2]|nr:hypothetical protein ACM39_03495 [Chryseobacterium sp. FH2]